MPQEIIDEFTRLNVSRQRKYQLRKQKASKCVLRGNPAVTAFHCETHRQKNQHHQPRVNEKQA